MQSIVKLSLMIPLDNSLSFTVWIQEWKFHFLLHLEATESTEGVKERIWDGTALSLISLHGWRIAGRVHRIDGPHKNVEMSTA